MAPRTGDPGSGRAHGDACSSTPCENAPSGAQAQVQDVEEGAPFPPNPGLTDTLIRLA